MTTSAYQPPYTITSEILNLIAAISEAVGRLVVLTDQTRALRLRRISRIRTIRGSLAIEGNTLSEAQITAILEGKRVIAPPREILITVTTPQVAPQVDELLVAIHSEMGREALQSVLGLSDRKSFRERYLKPALADGLIEMTIPDKPNSRLQKYRLTDKGRQWLAQNE
jgi:hypothetical protein